MTHILRIQYTLFVFGISLFQLNAQVDTIVTIQWDNAQTVNPYEVPNENKIFDFQKVESNYRDVLVEMQFLEKKQRVEINQISKKSSSIESNNKILNKKIKERERLLKDIEKLESTYTNYGVSKKLANTTKKYQKRYFEIESEGDLSDVSSPNSNNIYRNRNNINEIQKVPLSNLDELDKTYTKIPNYQCDIKFNGVEEKTLAQKIQLTEEPFFFYTHPKLIKHYKDQSFLTGEASIIRLGKEEFLIFKIVLKSKDAARTYGIIEKKEEMRLKSITGEYIYMPAVQEVEGILNEESEWIEYYVALHISKDSKRFLRNNEIDKVGIMWSSGFEEYEVFNVDLIMNQLACLKKL